MKKYFKLFLSLGIFCVLMVSCGDDDTSSQLEDQWQLTTVSMPDGTENHIDSVYYCFQKGTLFSFTVVINPDSSCVSYGYTSFPEDNRLRIDMDTTGLYMEKMRYVYDDFLIQSGWENYTKTFEIKEINNKRLVLEDSLKKLYTFRKY